MFTPFVVRDLGKRHNLSLECLEEINQALREAASFGLRDTFAAHALAGLMACDHKHGFEEDARRSYAAADAMLSARNKEQGE